MMTGFYDDMEKLETRTVGEAGMTLGGKIAGLIDKTAGVFPALTKRK